LKANACCPSESVFSTSSSRRSPRPSTCGQHAKKVGGQAGGRAGGHAGRQPDS
jgi:hypothetical protein